MTTTIALLRGINVGGNRKVAMGRVVTTFEDAGCTQVRTYIQSGNVVFTAPKRAEKTLKNALERALQGATGFEIPVMVRTAAEWKSVVRKNPYPNAELTQLHVAFLDAAPARTAWALVDRAALAPEEFVVRGRDVYLHLPNGIGRAKSPQQLKFLQPATMRNWRTVLKLAELADASE